MIDEALCRSLVSSSISIDSLICSVERERESMRESVREVERQRERDRQTDRNSKGGERDRGVIHRKLAVLLDLTHLYSLRRKSRYFIGKEHFFSMIFAIMLILHAISEVHIFYKCKKNLSNPTAKAPIPLPTFSEAGIWGAFTVFLYVT